MNIRMEHDSLGDVPVPEDAYWGAQTQRAIDNFPVSGIQFPPVFIRALGIIKLACAMTSRELGRLKPQTADAIAKACNELLEGRFADQFPLDIFQTGSAHRRRERS